MVFEVATSYGMNKCLVPESLSERGRGGGGGARADVCASLAAVEGDAHGRGPAELALGTLEEQIVVELKETIRMYTLTN